MIKMIKRKTTPILQIFVSDIDSSMPDESEMTA